MPTLRALYSDNPQQYADNLRGYLDANGIPPTAENLNRISLAVSQVMRGAQDTPPDFEQAVERTMQEPRRGTRRGSNAEQGQRRSTSPRDDSNAVRVNAGADAVDTTQRNVREGAMSGRTVDDVVNEALAEYNTPQTRGAQVAAGDPPGTARPGTIPRARVIDENDPTAGMFDPVAVGGRQADETGVDQSSLGMMLLAPLAVGANVPTGAALMNSPLGVMLQRRMLTQGAGSAGQLPPAASGALVAPTPVLPGAGPAGAAASIPRLAAPSIDPRAAALQMAGRPVTTAPRATGPSRGAGSGTDYPFIRPGTRGQMIRNAPNARSAANRTRGVRDSER